MEEGTTRTALIMEEDNTYNHRCRATVNGTITMDLGVLVWEEMDISLTIR